MLSMKRFFGLKRPKHEHPGVVQDNDSSFTHEPSDTSSATSFWQNVKRIFYKYLSFIGPGIMVSVAYMDPGNYATDISAGAANEFSLLFIISLSCLIAVFLQSLCVKLGSVTGLDLSRACRHFLPRWLNWFIYICAEVAVIATDLAEVIGGAIALNILLKIPLPAGICITCVDILIVLLAYGRGSSSMRMVRIFEIFVAALVIAVAICLCVDLAYIPPVSAGRVLRGFLPSKQMFQNNGFYTATGILGATVMPHSLFLGSGIVQPRLLEYDVKNGNYSMDINSDDNTIASGEKKSRVMQKDAKFLAYRPSIYAIRYAIKYSIVELTVTLVSLALFINCAILIIAGASLYETEQAVDADLYTIHKLLSSTLAPAAGTVFMLALLFSGQSSGVVCTIAGQIVCEGHINWSITPWKRRLITRGIAIVPTLVIASCLGKTALGTALTASQVVLSFILPIVTAPLIYFTSRKSIMQVEADPKNHRDGHEVENNMDNENNQEYINMSNNWFITAVAIVFWIFIAVLNIFTIVELFQGRN
ncbi:HBL284Cp [Eremothecium sinecaudum]|uniref:HBL284Cp n=1 Tax=Eremothecium sinecaudum TaxID=45286 RepID=A0A109UW11_9SACH|nr:HBL284Cp [Eremothecium sinecaudum]AMD18618.1 HBL284Cp [Eremothecium sinecaudum]